MRNNKERKNVEDLFTRLVAQEVGVACVREYRFHPKRRWRFDYAIPSHKIAIEIEGGVWTYGRHNRARGYLADMEKYNEATRLGWQLLNSPHKSNTPPQRYRLSKKPSTKTKKSRESNLLRTKIKSLWNDADFTFTKTG